MKRDILSHGVGIQFSFINGSIESQGTLESTEIHAAMRLLVPVLIAAAAFLGSAEAAPFECRPASMVEASAALPASIARLAQDRTLDVLAIGSSSTQGVGASSRDKSYPSRLHALLAQAWPQVDVEIVNAGIGGETAPQTLLRLKKALAERRYDLVIWQVGTNDAIRGGDIESFKAMVAEGIETVRDGGARLVILDQQFYPAIRNPQRYRSFVEAVSEVARAHSVPVLSRFAVMSGWHRHDPEAFRNTLAADGFHMSDTGYDCLARDMAASFTGMTEGRSRPALVQSAY